MISHLGYRKCSAIDPPKKVDYFQTRFALTSALTLDTDFSIFVWSSLSSHIRDLYACCSRNAFVSFWFGIRATSRRIVCVLPLRTISTHNVCNTWPVYGCWFESSPIYRPRGDLSAAASKSNRRLIWGSNTKRILKAHGVLLKLN